ncbi:MAG: RNA-binding protein [Hyphomicrobium sp.]|nr:MAG: RNA-binding protein [Hyphomicrobium sp.]
MSGDAERADHSKRAGGGPGEQRLDKWLWYARLTKSRTQAAALVSEGRVRVNRERTDKPSQTVRPGDVVTATVNRTVRILRVVGFVERRGPAAEAAAIYEELTPAADQTKARLSGADGAGCGMEAFADPRTHAEREPGSGRPTKRERREIDRLKNSSE